MKQVFIISISGIVQPFAFTSFKDACKNSGLNYYTCRKYRNTGLTRGETSITPVTVKKMKAKNTDSSPTISR